MNLCGFSHFNHEFIFTRSQICLTKFDVIKLTEKISGELLYLFLVIHKMVKDRLNNDHGACVLFSFLLYLDQNDETQTSVSHFNQC